MGGTRKAWVKVSERDQIDTCRKLLETGKIVLPSDVAAVFADATREALTNVRRHAGTSRASIRLGGDERRLTLDVADRGRGFSPDAVPTTRRGLRESVHGRLRRIGGTATVRSTVGAGTVVRLEWGDGDE